MQGGFCGFGVDGGVAGVGLQALAQLAGQFLFELPVAAQVEAVAIEHDGGVVFGADGQLA